MKPKHALIDKVISENRLRSDVHLGDEIGYSKSRICEIRAGRRQVSDDFRCAIVRRFGMTLKQVDALAPPKVD